MITADFTTTLVVDQTPAQAFQAIINVRGWWSEDIEGSTAQLNDEFDYHYEDVHYCKIKLVEVIPDKKMVWLVLDNHFNFTQDKAEWKGTKIVFDIVQQGQQTQIRFTHEGLVPAYECYNICRDAWTNYIQNSLGSLITTGKGQPNPKGGRNSYQEGISQQLQKQHYHVSMTVPVSAHEAFEHINNVSKWWTENIEGSSHKLNDTFTVHFGDIHMSTQKLVELIPDKKIVWLVTNSQLNFLQNKQEWNNTTIVFDILPRGTQTMVLFTHIGLVPQAECYTNCTKGWDQYIKESLFKLLTEGKGAPATSKRSSCIADN